VPTITALPAFVDNYIWVLHQGQQAVVVDPGDATPVLEFLQQYQLDLIGILVTHHHSDHTGGLAALAPICQGPIVGPLREQPKIPWLTQTVEHGESVHLLGSDWQVIAIPGHTAGHVAYFSDTNQSDPLLFCGDTLFSAGCGRLFEGSPADMHSSLRLLSALPAHTRVCCAHEYTLANLRFAQTVEPHNQDIAQHRLYCEQQRAWNLPTLPSSIGTEKKINPFLRTNETAVQTAACAFAQKPLPCDVDVLGALREWKNAF
jgi:hydroxyacylglutathione hydrolase